MLLSNRILSFDFDLAEEKSVIDLIRAESSEFFKITVDQILLDT
jgi:hypothetical protein